MRTWPIRRICSRWRACRLIMWGIWGGGGGVCKFFFYFFLRLGVEKRVCAFGVYNLLEWGEEKRKIEKGRGRGGFEGAGLSQVGVKMAGVELLWARMEKRRRAKGREGGDFKSFGYCIGFLLLLLLLLLLPFPRSSYSLWTSCFFSSFLSSPLLFSFKSFLFIFQGEKQTI